MFWWKISIWSPANHTILHLLILSLRNETTGTNQRPIDTRQEHKMYLFFTDDNKFSEATGVLFTWIDRGEVNRRTANHFYSMIQSANSHVRRLMNEKAQHEEEMEIAKEAFKNALMAILTQCKMPS